MEPLPSLIWIFIAVGGLIAAGYYWYQTVYDKERRRRAAESARDDGDIETDFASDSERGDTHDSSWGDGFGDGGSGDGGGGGGD